MNRNTIVTVALVAVWSMAATLVALWPAELNAADEKGDKPVAKLIQPELKVDGLKISPKVVVDKDGKHTLVLQAVNTTDKSVKTVVTVDEGAQPEAPIMGRRMPMVMPPRTKTIPIALSPGETKTVKVQPGPAALPGVSNGTIAAVNGQGTAQPLAGVSYVIRSGDAAVTVTAPVKTK